MSIKPKIISSAITSALIMAPVFANANEQPIEIERMTVTGVLPDRLDSVPGSFTIIDSEYLEARRPTTKKTTIAANISQTMPRSVKTTA